MSHRHQDPTPYKSGGYWYVRFYDNVYADGRVVRRRKIAQLAPANGEYRTLASVQPLKRKFLDPVNSANHVSMEMGAYWDRLFFPWLQAQIKSKDKKHSTVEGYKNLWLKQLKPRLEHTPLHTFKTPQAQYTMEQIAQQKLTTRSLLHIKHLLGSIFSRAIQEGLYEGANPMHEVKVPKGKKASRETKAYTLDLIIRMVAALPLFEGSAVATAGLAGLRRGELAGLSWENYDGKWIWVGEAAWRKITGDPKGKRSKGYVPVVPPLAKVLDAYRASIGSPAGRVWPGENGPRDMTALWRRRIAPSLKANGIPNWGWHALRRGLATNLAELGVSEAMIRDALRHADVQTTQEHYILKRPEALANAMQVLTQAVEKGRVQ